MKKVITGIFMMVTILAAGQENTNQESTNGVEKGLFRINILNPGLEYEIGLSQNTTLNLRAGTGFAYVKSDNEAAYGVFLTGEASYRHYYNFEKRASKGKNTSRNSANYISLYTFYSSADPIIGDVRVDANYLMQLGPAWGFQRTYKSGLNLGMDLGAGYVFSDNLNHAGVAPILNFRLGWAIGK